MSVLELIGVGKRSERPGQRWVLRDVRLQIEPGELVGIFGRRHSGRSTLLRIAAGLQAPDEGSVHVSHPEAGGAGSVRDGVRMARKRFRAIDGELVLDQLMTGQLVCGVPGDIARRQALGALARLGAQSCAGMRPSELSTAEAVLAAIARALTHAPRLLVIDEPTLGVELSERDVVLDALQNLAGEGTAVLASAGETASLSGFHRVLGLSGGRLRGQQSADELAPVVHLRAAGGAGG